MKKALILASVASMIDQFNMQNIQILQEAGYQVDVIANFKQGNTISDARILDLKKRLANQQVSVYHVPIPRKISDIKGIIKSLKQVREICNERRYDLVHCHSPIGGVVARWGAKKIRKQGAKVIYTAHGFHFYQGAPLKNWLIFYTIEKLCTRWTDVLITINKEDYAFAKKKFHIKCIEYVPGIGVDTKRFYLDGQEQSSKRAEIGLPKESVVLFTIGELNQNKNQEVIVRAMGKLKRPELHFVIAGQGNNGEYLMNLAKEQGVNLHLLGYRTDIPELFHMADMFVFPSIREGLSVSLMEAMSSGLPCVVSKIRGNVDLIDENGGYLCNPTDVDAFAKGITELIDDKKKRDRMGSYNRQVIEGFNLEEVSKRIRKIYFG